MRALRITSSILAGVCALSVPAIAQDVADAAAPAHIGFVDGSATLDREDVTEPAVPGTPIVEGDRVRTTSGRVEVLFPDGSALDVDEYSSIEMQAPGLLRVTGGRVILIVARAGDPASAARFQLDTPVASAYTDGPGEYRLSLLDGTSGFQTELAVVRGSGTLVTERGSVPLRAGERSVAWDNAAPSFAQSFNSARLDAFDRWAALRRDERMGSRSAQYLPPDLRMYGGALDRAGAWEYDAAYGNVWYPAVAPDWRPYYDGYWSAVPRYGWTWIGVDVWSWPTHHYGRWGFARARWFWIPERRFAPAWVSWGGAPGYVSWCPLGFNNRPVFALSISNRSTWAGWTVLSRDHFGGRGRNVHQYAVAPRTIPVNTPFIVQSTAPVAISRAVPRRTVDGATGPFSNASGQARGAGRQSPVTGRPAPGDNRPPQAVSRQPGIGGARAERAPGGRPQPDGPQTIPSQGSSDRRDRGAFRAPLPGSPSEPSPRSTDSVTYSNRGVPRNPASPSVTAPSTDQPPAGTAAPERPRYGIVSRRPSSAPSAPSSPAAAPPTAQPSGASASPERPRYGIASRRPSTASSAQSPSTAAPPAVQPPPSAPPERPRYGTSGRRPAAASSAQPPSASSSAPDPAPVAPPSRRGPAAAPRYERPSAPPPPAATAPPPPPREREARPAPAPQRDRQEARPRSQGAQPSSSSPPPERQQGGQRSRRPR